MRIGIALLSVAAACAQTAHQQHHPPRSHEEYVQALNDPKRDVWQMPHEVVMALDFKPQEAVADIGAGSGYFAHRFARHAGKVYAVDIEPKMIEEAKKGAPPNIEFVLAEPDDPKLPQGSVDTVFFCNVLHHVENRPAYYARLARALKPGGRIVIVDFHKKPLPVGPPESMKLSADQVVAELEAAGFRKTRQFDFLPYQYFFEFRTR